MMQWPANSARYLVQAAGDLPGGGDTHEFKFTSITL